MSNNKSLIVPASNSIGNENRVPCPNEIAETKCTTWTFQSLIAMFAAALTSSFLLAQDLPPGVSPPATKQLAPQFEAIWPDGSREGPAPLTQWSGDGRQAALSGKKLLGGTAPARVIRNLALPHRSLSGPFVEFWQGDLLPGTVLGLDPNSDTTTQSLLRFRPGSAVDIPGTEPREFIRIQLPWIRRLVWTQEPREELRPATVFRRDGTTLRFQKLRFQHDGVHLLTENGVATIFWDDLAELHFSAADWWGLYQRELAILTPDLTDAIVRSTTSSGMRFTTSLVRFQIWSRSEQNVFPETYQIIQPAWSDDVLCLRCAEIRQWIIHSPFEVPLSAVEPLRSDHQPIFSRLVNHWSRDANIRQGPLISGRKEFGWGIGVCGGHELEYPIPMFAARMIAGLGIDQAAGAGGCIRGRVEWSEGDRSTGKRSLHETELLIGSNQPSRNVSVVLPARQAGGRLSLVSDPVSNDPPAGADQFDLRDFVDWLEPTIELQPADWRTQVSKNVPQSLPMLAGWTIDGQIPGDWHPSIRWNPTTRPHPCFTTQIVLPGFPFSLKRKIVVPKKDQATYTIRTHRAERTNACRLDVMVNDRQLTRWSIPAVQVGETALPLSIDMSGFQGAELQLELRFVPVAGETRIIWEGGAF